MATRFWVGGTGSWTAANTANWAATSGGASGVSVPGAADTVTFDAASGGGTVTVGPAYNPTVTSITMGAFTGTLDFSANNNSPTMDTFSGTGTGVRTLNMGSGTWTLRGSGTTIVDFTTVTGLTLSAASATLNFTYSGSVGTRSNVFPATATGALGNINISAGTDSWTFATNNFTCANLNFTGFSGAFTNANGAPTLTGSLMLGTGMTVTSGAGAYTFTATTPQTITSNGVAFNKPITFSGVGGSWTLQDALNMGGASDRTLTLTNGTFNANNFNVTCGAFSSSNSNVRTLTMGSGTWTITGSGATIFSCSTSTNMTFTASTCNINCTYSGAVGTRTLSVGATMNMTGTSFNINAGTDIVSIGLTSGGSIGGVNFTGFTGTLTGGAGTTVDRFTGSVILGTGMTVTNDIRIWAYAGATTASFTSNGVVWKRPLIVGVSGGGGTLTFTDNFEQDVVSTSILTHSLGTLTANNANITTFAFSGSNANVRTLNMGSGTWTLTGSGTPWDITTATNLTLTPNTSTILLNDGTSATKTFAGGSKTYNNLTFSSTGIGAFIVTGSNTFNNFAVYNSPQTIQFTAGTTTAFNTFNVNGSSLSSMMTITSATAAQHTLKNNGSLPVIVTFCNISYSNAT